MEAKLQKEAEALATEMATQATTLEDVNGLMRTLMRSALERMLDAEMDVHLGRDKSTSEQASGAPSTSHELPV